MENRLPIYLDNNATTPLDPRVVDAMSDVLRTHFGNPASKTHSYGWHAEELVTIARENVAALVGAAPEEIIFTSGATESNNLAIQGVALRDAENRKMRGSFVSVVTEHRSVLDPLNALQDFGFKVSVLPVNKDGILDYDALRSAARDETCLVSVMLGNNEIGVLHDFAEVRKSVPSNGPLLHCDATQAIGKIPVDIQSLQVDLMSLSAHKIYGPKGIGALFIRKNLMQNSLRPLLYGGGHEHGLRSGTLNVAGIVGLGKACEILRTELNDIQRHLIELTTMLWNGLTNGLTGIALNGSREARLPGNLNLAFEGVDSALLIGKIAHKVAVSATSACTSQSGKPSFVLHALGLPEEIQRSSIRIGIGRFNTAAEIEFAIETITEAVSTLRK